MVHKLNTSINYIYRAGYTKKLMKRFWWLILVAVFTSGLFIPFTKEVEQNVKEDVFSVTRLTTNAPQIAKWYLPFKDEKSLKISTTEIIGGNRKLVISLKSPTTTVLTAYYNNTKKTFLLEVFPDSANSPQTSTLLSYNTTLLKQIIGDGILVNEARQSFARLKEHLENAELRYGFEIKQEKVTDTAFLVMNKLSGSANLQQVVDSMFSALLQFSSINKGGFTGRRIFYKQQVKGREYLLSAGIGISRIFPNKPNNEIEYQAMPYQKNLLVTVYTGPYAGITKAYAALNDFAADHNLISMAIPFEQWEEGPITVGDSDLVRLKVYLPVY